MRELPLPGVDASASLHGEGDTIVVLGHGAGGNRRTPMLVALAEAIAGRGRAALLYNFPYAEAGRRAPDPPRVLEAAARAAGALAVEASGARHVVHGGRSLGGRIASQVVAGGLAANAIAFFGYPLHAPGRPDRPRDAHLGRIAVPMLFVQGTRDAFAREDLLLPLIARLAPRAELARVAEADHSFRVLKRSGRTTVEVQRDVERAFFGWLERRGL